MLWGTKVDIIDCDLGPVGGLEKDYKGLKPLMMLYLCLPDVHRDPSSSRVATLMWTCLMHGPEHLSAEAVFGLKEFATAYRNFSSIKIGAEL
jgi:hypothetical protein